MTTIWRCVNCGKIFETKEAARQHWIQVEKYCAPLNDVMREVRA